MRRAERILGGLSFWGRAKGPRKARSDDRLRASPESRAKNLWIPGSALRAAPE